MGATYSAPLAGNIGFGLRDRRAGRRKVGTVLWGTVSTAIVASAVLWLLAMAGVAVALLLPKSAPAPPATSLSPASTVVAPPLSAQH
jgi:hypothetical protein